MLSIQKKSSNEKRSYTKVAAFSSVMAVRKGRSEVKRKKDNIATSERGTFSWQYCDWGSSDASWCLPCFMSANIRKLCKGVDFLPSLLAANARSFSAFLFWYFLPAMTEEIVYANLKFENSHELDNITEPGNTKEKGVVSMKLLWLILDKADGVGWEILLISCSKGLY